MKKIITVLLFLLLFSSNTCQHNIDKVVNEKTMISYDDTLNHMELESLFIKDTLPSNIENDWIVSKSLREDKKDMFYKYVYIKNLTDSTGTIYTLCTYQDTLYIINKRTIR